MPPLIPAAKLRPVAPSTTTRAAGHVLAPVVAHALDDGARARVPDREALAGDAAEERASRRRAVEDGVADDHVLLRAERRLRRRADGDRPAGQAFACVVVRLAVERELEPRREPGAERLAGGTVQLEVRTRAAGVPRDVVGEEGTDGAVHVPHLEAPVAAVEGCDQPVVECLAE